MTATEASVTIESLAIFSNADSSGIVTALGWYAQGNATLTEELFTVGNDRSQTINVQATGKLAFEPGSTPFGFYTRWPSLNNRQIFSQDSLNVFLNAIPHHFRVYPLKNQDGTVILDSYLIAVEGVSEDQDYQDLVFIVRNVKPFTAAIPQDSVANSRLQVPAVSNTNSGLELRVYPNPNSGRDVAITLKHFAGNEQVSIGVYDLSGKLIASKSLVTDNQGTVTTQFFKDQPVRRGMYIIKAESSAGVIYSKLIAEQ